VIFFRKKNMGQTAHAIRCRCGQLEGLLSTTAGTTHLVCYCRFCQAYAHLLGHPEQVLDELGGTDVVATVQQHLRFTKGTQFLACLSMSRQGPLRWYASCCNTPIGATARNPKLSYLGLVHTCLGESAAALDAQFGTGVAVNPKHAKGKVAYSAVSTLLPVTRIMASVAQARISGSWKHSPFFQPGSATPVATPRVLGTEERKRAFEAAGTVKNG
jgi:hypothetical protein